MGRSDADHRGRAGVAGDRISEDFLAYLDDWYQTSSDERRRLQESCERTACGHPRHAHGTTVVGRAGGWRYIQYAPGHGRNCRCPEFLSERDITKDDVLNVHDALAGTIRLADHGIASACYQAITRWTELGTVEVHCDLQPGHSGAHAAG